MTWMRSVSITRCNSFSDLVIFFLIQWPDLTLIATEADLSERVKKFIHSATELLHLMNASMDTRNGMGLGYMSCVLLLKPLLP